VIVPAHQAERLLPDTLGALVASDFPRERWELIVVDDGSHDDTAIVAGRYADTVIRLPGRPHGPAYARNRGAEVARGDIVLFFDADVRVKRDTLSRFARAFAEQPEVGAIFGSYDDAPPAPGFVSQYRNLLHHYTHQKNAGDVETFWAGCGGVRRELFLRLGGFNEKRYREPSIEDIELGYRLRRAGCSILLDRQLQVQHLKCWTLLGMLRADIFRRAVPWSNLMLERRHLSNDLNLRTGERVSALATVLALMLLALSFVSSYLLLAPASLLLMLVFILNRRMYAFFLRRMGPHCLPGVTALHLLYYCYSSAVFTLCCIAHVFRKRKQATMVEEKIKAY